MRIFPHTLHCTWRRAAAVNPRIQSSSNLPFCKNMNTHPSLPPPPHPMCILRRTSISYSYVPSILDSSRITGANLHRLTCDTMNTILLSFSLQQESHRCNSRDETVYGWWWRKGAVDVIDKRVRRREMEMLNDLFKLTQFTSTLFTTIHETLILKK